MLLPLPADRTTTTFPWALIGLVAATALVSVTQFDAILLTAFLREPIEGGLMRDGFHLHQLLTHVFLHISPGHLIGNMAFLIAVGYHLNLRMGHLRFLAAYFAAGAAAGAAWLLLGDGVAAIGASGAVMGMVALYLVLLPTLRVRFMVWWPVYVLGGLALLYAQFDLPGLPLFLFIAVYAVLAVVLAHREVNLVGGSLLSAPLALLGFATFSLTSLWVVALTVGADVLYLLSDAPTGVAHEAHLGGAAAGLLLGVLLAATNQVRGSLDNPTALQVLGLQSTPAPAARPALAQAPWATTRRTRRTNRRLSYSQWENETLREREAAGQRVPRTRAYHELTPHR